MADIPVNASPAVVTVDVVTNGQVVFDYDFRADTLPDLRARYNYADGTSLDMVGGADFSATGLGGATGGTITLTSFVATVAGDTLTIFRETIIDRLTDLQRDLFAATLNTEFDKIYMILQELERDLGLALTVPVGDVPPDIGDLFLRIDAALEAATAAEGWANVAQAAANNNLSFVTRAAAASATIDAGIHSITTKGDAVEGDGLGGLYIDTDNGSSDTFTSADGRTWYRVADIGFGRINIGAQPGPKGIEYFNSSITRCSSGNYTVDFNALQAGLDSEYAVDIACQKLQIEDTIAITKQESMLMSSIDMPRNGSGDVRRSAQITVMDNALPVLFDVQTYNARFQGFRTKCDPTNVATTVFKCLRADTHTSDLDVTIKRCSLEYGNRHVHMYGRGLQFSDNEVVGAKDAVAVLDWDPDWVTNGGNNNDLLGTAQRAYTITQIRQHGNRMLVRNTGTLKHHIADILISDIQGDTGGGVFEGVLNHSLINNVQCHYHPTSQDVFILEAGSKFAYITNFSLSGFVNTDRTIDRTPTRAIYIKPDDSPSTIDVVFANGKIGPTNSQAVRIGGGGYCAVTFDNVSFVDAGINTGDTPNAFIYALAERSQTITNWDILLRACTFRTLQALSPPSFIVGGNQNALIKVYRDFMTRQVGMSATWTAPTMTSITS